MLDELHDVIILQKKQSESLNIALDYSTGDKNGGGCTSWYNSMLSAARDWRSNVGRELLIPEALGLCESAWSGTGPKALRIMWMVMIALPWFGQLRWMLGTDIDSKQLIS